MPGRTARSPRVPSTRSATRMPRRLSREIDERTAGSSTPSSRQQPDQRADAEPPAGFAGVEPVDRDDERLAAGRAGCRRLQLARALASPCIVMVVTLEPSARRDGQGICADLDCRHEMLHTEEQSRIDSR